MTTFDAYAAYYDLLYGSKDYAGEVEYVHALLQRHRPGSADLLELGSGTGKHALQLAAKGYALLGIDVSTAMVLGAVARANSTRVTLAPEFRQGDLRNYRAGRQFDAVLALFHVMSYQTTNADLSAAMATAVAHLRPGGLFLFDCWYGPGVLTDPPVERVREVSAGDLHVTRTSRPILHPNENRVDVVFDVEVRAHGRTERFSETHAMRYLFGPETKLLMELAGLEFIGLERWMEGGDPDLSTWNAMFIAAKR